jgi:hypothetical protein
MKKTWVKPTLVVLTRSKTEEAVLQNCKTAQIAGPGTVGSECICVGAGCTRCLGQSTS